MPSLHLVIAVYSVQAQDLARERRIMIMPKEFTTPVKVESLSDARRLRFRRYTSVGYTAAQMLSLSLVDAWCLWRAPLDETTRGRCNERLKPIEFFCGCSPQTSRSHCLLIAIRRFARAGIQSVENALMMSVIQGCICSNHYSKQISSRNA